MSPVTKIEILSEQQVAQIESQTRIVLEKCPDLAIAQDMLALASHTKMLMKSKNVKRYAGRLLAARKEADSQANLIELQKKENERLRKMLDTMTKRTKFLADECEELNASGPLVKKLNSQEWILKAAKTHPAGE